MRLLFEMDSKDYTDEMPVVVKDGVRALICHDGKYAMQLSGKGEYKIPGGGKEGNETDLETLIREVREEVGLVVIPESVKPIGEIIESRQDAFNKGVKFVRKSRYYTCEVTDEVVETCMTLSEIKKGFHPVWADIDEIITGNEKSIRHSYLMRDTEFFKWYRNEE